jgi:hypothetical protein
VWDTTPNHSSTLLHKFINVIRITHNIAEKYVHTTLLYTPLKIWVMLNSAPGTLVKHTKKGNKREIQYWEVNFLQFQRIKCTHFETNF